MNGSQTKHVFCVHNNGDPKSSVVVCLWTTRMNDYKDKEEYEIVHQDSLLTPEKEEIISCETNKEANEIGNYFVSEEFEQDGYLKRVIISWLESVEDGHWKIHNKFAVSWDGHGRDNKLMYDDYKCFFLDILESMLNHLRKWNKTDELIFKSPHLMFAPIENEGKVDEKEEEQVLIDFHVVDTAKFEQNDVGKDEDSDLNAFGVVEKQGDEDSDLNYLHIIEPKCEIKLESLNIMDVWKSWISRCGTYDMIEWKDNNNVINIECIEECKLDLEFDLLGLGVFLQEFKLWLSRYMEEETNYFNHLENYENICLDWSRICKLIADVLIYNGENCKIEEIVRKFVDYKWRIYCLAFCWKCGDLTYCKKCNVRLYCSCSQVLCTKDSGIEDQISMTNDLPNCWCVDCHVVDCWNACLCWNEFAIV